MDKLVLQYTIGALAVPAFLIHARHWTTSSVKSSAEFTQFQLKYLVVVLMMKTADWLQGPYVYKLYEQKGFSEADSSKLFVTGFASSAFFGVLVGSLADKHGRKKGAVTFAVLYAVACALYHSNDFKWLVVGRVCSGIATSLLFSVFEAWYKAEHERKNFDGSWVSQTFARQTFADSLLAIASGLCASYVVTFTNSSLAPFQMSGLFLILGGILVVLWWGENSSCEASESEEDNVTIVSALHTIFQNQQILLCGVVQSLFGGSMYVFVFMWTPSLPNCDPGLVFSAFMVAILIGAGIFQELEKRGWHLVDIVCFVLVGASFSFAIPILTKDVKWRLASFVLFEICVGIWFPSYHTLRMQLVPDRGHATILSFFRFPLCLITICVIVYSSSFSKEMVFACCFGMIWICIGCILQIRRLVESASKKVA